MFVVAVDVGILGKSHSIIYSFFLGGRGGGRGAGGRGKFECLPILSCNTFFCTKVVPVVGKK